MSEPMKIYTKFGDKGKTQILKGVTLQKSDDRIELIGTLDELNSVIGVALSHEPTSEMTDALLVIQNELFEWGAVAAGASAERHNPPTEESIGRLEKQIDAWQSQLEPMTHFILPGGSKCGAQVHLVRTVCRRAERVCTGLIETSQDEALAALQMYLNRLSDWLFVAARIQNQNCGVAEAKWQPR